MSLTDTAKPAASAPTRPLASARAPQTAMRAPRRVNPFLIGAGFLLFFAVGVAAGSLIMRQRYKTRDVIVAVNGAVFTKDDLFRQMERVSGPQTLRQMVSDEMRRQYARKLGVAPTSAQVEASYAEISKTPDFDKMLASSGITPDELKRDLATGMAKSALVTRNMQATEAEERQYYQENIDRNNVRAMFYTPESARLAVIVTPSEATGQAAAQALQAGVAFPKVAQKYSTDDSKRRGGLLPLVVRGRTQASRVPGLEEAAFALRIGGQTGPRKFGSGWWIIRCLDKTPAVLQPFEQVKAACETGVRTRKGVAQNGAKMDADYEEFYSKANVQAFWPQYKQALRQP